MRVSILVLAVALIASVVNAAHYCVVNDKNGWEVLPSHASAPAAGCDSAVLTGEYNYTLETIGWDVLNVVTSAAYTDEKQAYAAGFFEGSMTYNRCMNMYDNQLKTQNLSTGLTGYLTENAQYIEQQCAAQASASSYWFQVCLMWQQFNGMLDGLNKAKPTSAPAVTQLQLMLLASQGDLLDLTLAFPAKSDVEQHKNDWRKMNRSEFDLYIARKSHCSALVKVAPGMENIFFGHATWQSFTFAIRIFKSFTLNFKSTNAKKMQFSSYAGALSSTDDYYVMDSGFAVIETSLNVFNTSIYKGTITPKSVLSWMRVMVANRMATSGADWVEKFSYQNSGTYNNQWMVLNLNLFTPKQSIQPDTLWIAEQMPGIVASDDMSGILQYGYWPSYNVPNFLNIYNLAGYPEAVKQQGHEMLDYQTCVRAQQFRMISPTVTNIDEMKYMMQYNQFMVDGISDDNPGWAVASRFDLTPTFIGQAQTFGAIDAKISDYNLFKNGLQVHAYSGPTPQQETFSWATTKAKSPTPHVGVPEVFNFTWQLMQPSN